VLLFVLPALIAYFTWRTCHDLEKKGAREDDYPRPYPKARTPYQVTDAAGPSSETADVVAAPRSTFGRTLAAIGAAVAAAGGFLIGRRRPKKIVFEETRKR
jgi:hypothetical protein